MTTRRPASQNGPKGPYITDKDDGIKRTRRPGKRPLPARTETEITKEGELGSDRSSGRNA